MPIAENEVSNGNRTPLELHFNNTHYFKMGLGFKRSSFDIGFYYSRFVDNRKLKDKFANTYPLSTGANYIDLGEDGGNFRDEITIYPEDYENAYVTGLAKSKFDFKHIDFEAGAKFKIGEIAIRVSLAARYAKYNQSLTVERRGSRICAIEPRMPHARVCRDPFVVVDDEPIKEQFPNATYENNRQMDMGLSMYGPKLGLSVSVPLTNKLNLVGGVNWAVLFGERNLKDNYKTKHILRTMTPGNREIKAYENEPFIVEVDAGGFIEKDKNIIVHNLAFKAGLEYDFVISDSSILSFLAGYRYDIHYGVRTTCGSSRIKERAFANSINTPLPDSYGNCGKRFENGILQHGDENFISHGPFLRTTITF